MKYASFFSGIGGFELALDAAGFQRVFSCEIDPFCNEVFKARWDHECEAKDITALKPEEIPDADLWVGGWPCQDLSVAGKRAGIKGARSGLFWSIMKLVKKRNPRFLLLENVPGLLSSNNGQDVMLVLDEINNAGYLVDLDIVDAQFAGVPQRRRRTFFVCERLDAGLKKKSDFSLRGICTAIIDELLFVFRGLTARSPEWPRGSSANAFAAGHERRERFFSSSKGRKLWPRLLDVFLDALRRWPHNCAVSGCLSREDQSSFFGEGEEEASTRGIGSGGIQIQKEGAWLSSSTSLLWKGVLDAASRVKSGSTISTLSQQTIEQKIYTCAETAVFISERIVASRIFCPRWSEAALFALTAVKECIAYAGFASECVFASLEWRKKWRDFRVRSEGFLKSLGHLGADRFPEILLEPQGGGGNPEAGRQKGKIASGEIKACLSSAGNDGGFRTEPGEHLVAHGVSASKGHHGHSSPRGDGTDDLVVGDKAHAVSRPSGGGLGGRDGQDDYVVGALTSHKKKHGSEATSGQAAESGHIVAAPLTRGSHPNSNAPGRRRKDKTGTLCGGEKGGGKNEINLPLIAFQPTGGSRDVQAGEKSPPIKVGSGCDIPSPPAVAFEQRIARNGRGAPSSVVPPLKAESGQTGKGDGAPSCVTGTSIRRLTCTECERLQGGPDGWTDHCHQGKASNEILRVMWETFIPKGISQALPNGDSAPRVALRLAQEALLRMYLRPEIQGFKGGVSSDIWKSACSEVISYVGEGLRRLWGQGQEDRQTSPGRGHVKQQEGECGLPLHELSCQETLERGGPERTGEETKEAPRLHEETGSSPIRGDGSSSPDHDRKRDRTKHPVPHCEASEDDWTFCAVGGSRIPPWVDPGTFRLGGCGHSACGCTCSDSARYRALGNAVAVPVIRWIAERMKQCLK